MLEGPNAKPWHSSSRSEQCLPPCMDHSLRTAAAPRQKLILTTHPWPRSGIAAIGVGLAISELALGPNVVHALA